MASLIKSTRYNGNHSEGLGSMLQSQLHLYAYCRINNFIPCLNKLTKVAHYQYSNYTSEEFDKKINNFFSFLDCDNHESENIDNFWLISNWGEKHNNEKKEYISELSSKIIYDDDILFDKNKTQVSVHIRNVNSQDVCFNPNREYFEKNKETYFINLFENIMKHHGTNLTFNIFSQGKKEEFKFLYDKFDCILHLDVDIIKTFYHMIYSDIFVAANSSLSWCAHLFGQNDFVYCRENFFHSWYENTIKVDINGNFKNLKI